MRALVQRVTSASVTVEGRTVGAIGPGLCVFVGVTHTDDAEALIAHLHRALQAAGARVAAGRFRAEMAVTLVNDGPFTVLVEV